MALERYNFRLPTKIMEELHQIGQTKFETDNLSEMVRRAIVAFNKRNSR